jgi:hypothetical protein
MNFPITLVSQRTITAMNLMGQITPNGNDGTYHSMHKLLNSDSRNSPLDNAEKKY